MKTLLMAFGLSSASSLASAHTTMDGLEKLMNTWQNETLMLDGTLHHYYRTGGDKPPLVLLHGFMASGKTWWRTTEALADRFDVIMPDARGHGNTNSAPDGLTFDTLADDVAHLIEALTLDLPIVLGHSMGAGTAARLAARRPGLVSALVLVDPGVRTPPPPPAPGTEAYERWYKPFLTSLERIRTLDGEARAQAYLAFYPPAASWHPEDVENMAEAQATFDLDVLNGSLPTYDLDNLIRDVSQVSVPLLLITGDPAKGSSAPPEAVKALRSSWQRGKHVHVSAGHLITFEAFDAFRAALDTFLNEVGAER